MGNAVQLLVLNGTVGVGKSSLGYAASDILAQHRVPHAFVDRDALCVSWPPLGRFNDDLAYRNLASVWRNFREAGAERLIVSGVVESAPDLDRFRVAVDRADIAVCWVRASLSTCEARLRARNEGESLKRHLARTVELEAILEEAGIHDFEVWNEHRTVTDVAREALGLTGWISG